MITALFRALADTALAQTPPPPTICGGASANPLPGCGGAAQNIIATNVIPSLAVVGIRLAASLALLFIIIAGIALMLAQDDGARTTAKKAIIYSLGGLLLSLGAGIIVSFVATEQFGQGLPASSYLFGGLIGGAVRILLTLSNVVLVLVIIYEGIEMVLSRGKTDEFTKARQVMMWAAIGAVVVNISRVLVNIALGVTL